jgi:hypothetical protein
MKEHVFHLREMITYSHRWVNTSQVEDHGSGERKETEVMATCLFEILPEDLFRLCFQYLSFSEVGTLDNSMINHALRPCFLSALNGTAVSHIDDDKYIFEYYHWIFLRNVFTKSVAIGDIRDEVRDLISKNQPCLESISIRHTERFTIDFFPRLANTNLL